MKYSCNSTIVQQNALLSMEQSTNTNDYNNSTSDQSLVGLLVTISEIGWGDNRIGTVGVIYYHGIDEDEPDTHYIAILLETGEDLLQINENNLCSTFMTLGQENFSYKFTNAEELQRDFEKGIFAPLFNIANRRMRE